MKKNGNDDAVNGLKVLGLPEIYTLIDSSTRLPALSEGGACFIFTERGFADEALDWHLQRMRNWYVIAIEQKNIYPFLGSEFYNNGAHFVIIDDGQEGKETRSPEELVPRPDFSAVNELNTLSVITNCFDNLCILFCRSENSCLLVGYDADSGRQCKGAAIQVNIEIAKCQVESTAL